MLGFMILVGLVLWIALTIAAIGFGKKVAGTKGAVVGFMVLMGGWLVYWAAEYAYIQHKVTKLCESEGGVTVYVTPEQWRKQIGEKEWEKLIFNKNRQNQYKKSLNINFEGDNYQASSSFNERLVFLSNYRNLNSYFINKSILYDVEDRKTIYKVVNISVPEIAVASSLLGLKPWLNSINDCQSFTFSTDSLLKKYSVNKFGDK